MIKQNGITSLDNPSLKLLVKLLSIPLETLSLSILGMTHYPVLMKYMKFQNRKTVAMRIVKAVLKMKKILSNTTIVG